MTIQRMDNVGIVVDDLKVQLVTIDELLHGHRLNIPTPITPYLTAPKNLPQRINSRLAQREVQRDFMVS